MARIEQQKKEAVQALLEKQRLARIEQQKLKSIRYYQAVKDEEDNIIGYRKSDAYINNKQLPQGQVYPTKKTITPQGVTTTRTRITQKDIDNLNRNVDYHIIIKSLHL